MRARRILITVGLLAVAACLAGCETMAAFGTGRITRSDLAYLTSTGTGSVADSDDIRDASGAPREGYSSSRIKDADAWIRKNLW